MTDSRSNFFSVADPGFSRGGGANSKISYYLANFFPRTAWNWKNLDPGARPWRPLRSANAFHAVFGKKKVLALPPLWLSARPPPPPFWEIQGALLIKRMLLKTLRLIVCNNPLLPPYIPVADPGLSWGGGGNSQRGCVNLSFCKFLLKTALKWKNLNPERGASLVSPRIRQCIPRVGRDPLTISKATSFG